MDKFYNMKITTQYDCKNVWSQVRENTDVFYMCMHEYIENERTRVREHMNDNWDSKKQWKLKPVSLDQYKGTLSTFSLWNCIKNLTLFKKVKSIM